ncbi:MAG: hypothetical protein E6J62_18435 [Deltaproteobacteria bacterium]|nr:MAG: hypothetical protein E6J62_18435 [Deltaproteobacteria bacterium]
MNKDGRVHFGDTTRQAALFETMILAAGSDGSVTKVEVEEIYRRVFERPEFNGIHAGDLKAAISHAAQVVAKAKGRVPQGVAAAIRAFRRGRRPALRAGRGQSSVTANLISTSQSS